MATPTHSLLEATQLVDAHRGLGNVVPFSQEDLATLGAKDLGTRASLVADCGLFTRVSLAKGEEVLREKPYLFATFRGPHSTAIWKLTADALAAGADAHWTCPRSTEEVQEAVGWDSDDEREACDLEARFGSRKRVVAAYYAACSWNMASCCGGFGLYYSLAKVNHSCAPNVVIRDTDLMGSKQMLTLRAIEAGEELCVSYCHAKTEGRKPLPTSVRRQHMKMMFGWECACWACKLNLDLEELGSEPDMSLVEHMIPRVPPGHRRCCFRWREDGCMYVADMDPTIQGDTPVVYCVERGYENMPCTEAFRSLVAKAVNAASRGDE